MNFYAVLFTLIWSLVALADDSVDLRFLETQRSRGNPMALPIRINQAGEVSYFDSNGLGDLIFRPTVQLRLSKPIINYSHPVILNRFNFFPQQSDLGWIEVRRLRIEVGVGLAAIMKEAVTVGLMPYKGALQTIIRHKKSSEEKSLPFFMPKKLADLEGWNENDHGTFQTYGGITAYAGFSTGIIDIALGSIGIQNQFIVEMKRMSNQFVKLIIREEDLKRRQIIAGPNLVEITVAQFKGKRFSTEFTLDLENPLHHELFEKAMNGDLKAIQEKLDFSLQKLSWQGSDRSFYVGIPVLYGKVKDAGHYNLNEDEKETELDFTGSRSKGILSPLMNLQDFAYQTDEAMVVAWTSEMNKTTKKLFEKRFLNIGKIIGIKGFNREVPANTKFGSIVSQIAIHLSKNEVELIKDIDIPELEYHLKFKCEEQKLSCMKDIRSKKLMKKLVELKMKSWKEMRGDFGLLLMKEPALIYAIVKTMKFKKEVYFKFLSEKFQSLEGTSAIEI